MVTWTRWCDGILKLPWGARTSWFGRHFPRRRMVLDGLTSLENKSFFKKLKKEKKRSHLLFLYFADGETETEQGSRTWGHYSANRWSWNRGLGTCPQGLGSGPGPGPGHLYTHRRRGQLGFLPPSPLPPARPHFLLLTRGWRPSGPLSQCDSLRLRTADGGNEPQLRSCSQLGWGNRTIAHHACSWELGFKRNKVVFRLSWSFSLCRR